MNTPRGQGEWTQDPEALSQEIDETRADVGDTLEALQQKLSPSQILDQSVSYLGERGYEIACRVGDMARRNPVPFAIAGAGLLWMMVSRRRRNTLEIYADDELLGDEYDTSVAYDTSASYDTSLGDEGVAGGTSGVGDRVRSVASSARQRASGAAQAVAGGASRAQRAVRRGASRASGGFERMLHEQPLVIGAIGVAVGAAIAAMLPLTDAEDRVLGDASERVVQRAREKTGEQLQKVRDTARRAAEGARSALQQQGGEGVRGSTSSQQRYAGESGTSGGASMGGSTYGGSSAPTV